MTRPDVLIADPPWKFRDNLPGKGRGASKHYATMKVHEIARMPLPPIGDNAILFLWRVAAMQEEALFVCRAWGFVPYGEAVWIKETSTGKRFFGMGRVLRGEHEAILLGKRGTVRPEALNVRSTFRGPVGAHSEKPEAFYSFVRTLYSKSRKVELFARRTRKGFEQYGDQLGILDTEAAG